MTGHALLFDLDGTLVDTDLLHHAAFVTLLAERGETLSLPDYKTHVMGKSNAEIQDRYFATETEADGRALLDRKEALFRDSLAATVAPVAGVHALLDWAERTGTATAVVTNAPRANATAMLAAAGLADRLPLVVIGEECTRPKPDPAPYREAMRRLGVTPSRSIAFEDSPSGLRAARGADRQLVADVALFDRYAGKGMPDGKVSLAIQVTLQPREATLTDAQIEAAADRIVAAVAKATGAVLRA